jgi:hypothetical protein
MINKSYIKTNLASKINFVLFYLSLFLYKDFQCFHFSYFRYNITGKKNQTNKMLTNLSALSTSQIKKYTSHFPFPLDYSF